MPNVNENKTSGLSLSMATYYDKKLIMNAKPNLVHYRYGQTSVLPKNAGKTIDFRKWTPFDAATDALTEGAAPDGQTLSMSHVTADIAQYGGYVAVSDMLDMTALDPVVNDSVELMGDQGGLTIDTLVREEISAGSNVMYAGGKTARHLLTSTDVLTVADVRKAVRALKRAKAPMFVRGAKSFYVAIVSPDAVYDLQSDSAWQDASKYAGSEQIFDGEMGRLYGVVFVETTEKTTYTGETLAAVTPVVASYSNKVITLSTALTSAEATALAGRKIIVDGVCYEVASATSSASAGTITVKEAPNASNLPTASDTVYPGEAGAAGASMSCTLVFGRNAYGVVELEGGNLRSIIKPKGSAGTSDPLDQISTIGWKVDGFAAKILQPLWLLRIEHAVTA